MAYRTVRVAHNGNVPVLPGEIDRQHIGFRLRHHEHGTPRGREVVAGGIHLAEVGIAGDSGEVAKENEQEELAIQKRRNGRESRPAAGR